MEWRKVNYNILDSTVSPNFLQGIPKNRRIWLQNFYASVISEIWSIKEVFRKLHTGTSTNKV